MFASIPTNKTVTVPSFPVRAADPAMHARAHPLPDVRCLALIERFNDVRRATMRLAAPLSAEDCCAQSMEDASPVKWHLAHTTWFFETFILERSEPSFRAFNPAFRTLFNSYYDGIGERPPRRQRGLLTRPSLQEVVAYRDNVDERVTALLVNPLRAAEIVELIELGLQHEQQHQELLLTDVKHLLSMNPMRPAYAPRPMERANDWAHLDWIACEGGLVEIGHAGEGFLFDNEAPRHRQFLEPFRIASRLVTNAEYLTFVEDGGYRNPACWLSEGWSWITAHSISRPLYWQHDEKGWLEFTLHGMQSLEPGRPAVHLSSFEADAYARWADARLPTEAEWEWMSESRGQALSRVVQRLHPASARQEPGEPMMLQRFDAAWQWTSSSYAPYPGYRPAPGAIGEYNSKFMVNQYVLRGGACITPTGHSRPTYRNFFPASARWQFSGIRLARD